MTFALALAFAGVIGGFAVVFAFAGVGAHAMDHFDFAGLSLEFRTFVDGAAHTCTGCGRRSDKALAFATTVARTRIAGGFTVVLAFAAVDAGAMDQFDFLGFGGLRDIGMAGQASSEQGQRSTGKQRKGIDVHGFKTPSA
jgi:hypothetical protein